jgi:hypothetical protein
MSGIYPSKPLECRICFCMVIRCERQDMTHFNSDELKIWEVSLPLSTKIFLSELCYGIAVMREI